MSHVACISSSCSVLPLLSHLHLHRLLHLHLVSSRFYLSFLLSVLDTLLASCVYLRRCLSQDISLFTKLSSSPSLDAGIRPFCPSERETSSPPFLIHLRFTFLEKQPPREQRLDVFYEAGPSPTTLRSILPTCLLSRRRRQRHRQTSRVADLNFPTTACLARQVDDEITSQQSQCKRTNPQLRFRSNTREAGLV